MTTTKSIFERLRALTWVLLIAFVIACFWIVFSKIDLQLNKFNHNVLRVVNSHKYQLVQREFDHIDHAVTMLEKAVQNEDQKLFDFLLHSDSIYSVFSSTVFWKKDVSGSFEKGRVFLGGQSPPNSPLFDLDTIRFVAGARPKLDVYRSYEGGLVLFEVDLIALHNHFEDVIVDGKAYFELYDHVGNYLIHPDINKVGQFRDDIAFEFANKRDTVLNSDFVGVPFVRSAYDIKGIFQGTKLFVYAPLSLTDVEVFYIGGFSMILSVSGVFLMLVLLYFLNREHRKAERLELANIAFQKEEALLRFENLKRKVDPHFLFNALGSLQQLIGKDPGLAKTFVGKMARVYRKFLKANASGLTSVRDEVVLAQEYYFLQRVRFGESLLDIDFDLPSAILSKQIPRFSMQVAIENAIKHNEFDVDNPLEIMIYLEEGRLCISNTFRVRAIKEESSGYGLSLLSNVYDYYQVSGFSYGKSVDVYRVCLPFIQND